MTRPEPGYEEVKQCFTKVVKADGIPIELTFGTFFNQRQFPKIPLAHLNDIFRVTIEKIDHPTTITPSNGSAKRDTHILFFAMITMSFVNNYVNLLHY